MQGITIEHAAFQHLTERLETIEGAISQQADEVLRNAWLSSEQVRDLLGICVRTLQNYRDKGVLGFSAVGKKFYYRATEVQAHLEKHYQAPFAAKVRQG